MPRFKGTMDVGNIMVTRQGPWYVSMAIRLGAWLKGRPSICNHVIIVHHVDPNGIWWGIEGRPGGVGYVPLEGALSSRYTNANTEQPISEDSRYLIAVAAESLLGMGYDWGAIAADAAHVFAANYLWQTIEELAEWKPGQIPAHVVCSAFADWAYETVNLPNPGGTNRTRFTTPGDWDKFIMDRGWEKP